MAAVRWEVTTVDSLEDVDVQEWEPLTQGNPFVSHGFLSGLARSGCVSDATGWHSKFVLCYRNGRLAGAAPSYFKSHSRGEFVFDQGWADAFARYGLDYYPKLVVASPFTPVQGPRLLAVDDEARAAIVRGIVELAKLGSASSVHVLFVEKEDRQVLAEAGFMLRENVQFHWRNDEYTTVEDFLHSLTQEKRKKIKQDGKYVAQSGIQYTWLEGESLTAEYLEFFYACYCNTYKEHWSSPYLSFDFFLEMHESRALHFLLVLAHRDQKPIACALNVLGHNTLYGRYWGSMEFCKGLHFETCYLQAIKYCIERKIAIFEGGAQGEHKMARGLMPVKTYSAHWISDNRFAEAISNFLEREAEAIDRFLDGLVVESPFKK